MYSISILQCMIVIDYWWWLVLMNNMTHFLIWLVVTGTWILFFHMLGMSSSQLTFIVFRGVGIPPTRLMMLWDGVYRISWDLMDIHVFSWDWTMNLGGLDGIVVGLYEVSFLYTCRGIPHWWFHGDLMGFHYGIFWGSNVVSNVMMVLSCFIFFNGDEDGIKFV